jgi:hypothetical protein
VVERGAAYIGHMRSPDGTSIVDVRDPKRPRVVATLGMSPGTHSHKVRVHAGVMLVNHELTPPTSARSRLTSRPASACMT